MYPAVCQINVWAKLLWIHPDWCPGLWDVWNWQWHGNVCCQNQWPFVAIAPCVGSVEKAPNHVCRLQRSYPTVPPPLPGFLCVRTFVLWRLWRWFKMKWWRLVLEWMKPGTLTQGRITWPAIVRLQRALSLPHPATWYLFLHYFSV